MDEYQAPPEETKPDTCSQCGGNLFVGFGLAGGGYGTYGMCDDCSHIEWKVQEEE